MPDSHRDLVRPRLDGAITRAERAADIDGSGHVPDE
jgi:hypothetical protein